MISIQLIFASHKRDKSKFPKIEFDLTDTAKANIDPFLYSSNPYGPYSCNVSGENPHL